MATESEVLYNRFAKSKKQQKYIWNSSLIFMGLCFISGLIFLYLKSNQVIVIRESGQRVEAAVGTEEETFQAHAKLHLATTFKFLNTFDRFTEKSNRGKTLLHMEKRAADRIWSIYNDQGVFADVRAKGVTYKGEIDPGSIIVSNNIEPFRFTFIGYITKNDKGIKETFKATCSGDMIYYTPIYPQKPTGFFVTNFQQILEPYESK